MCKIQFTPTDVRVSTIIHASRCHQTNQHNPALYATKQKYQWSGYINTSILRDSTGLKMPTDNHFLWWSILTSKVGQTDPVFGVQSGFISRPVHLSAAVMICATPRQTRRLASDNKILQLESETNLHKR